MNKIAAFVKKSDHPDGPFMVISEVAEYFERSRDTIRRWGKQCGVPSHKMPLNDAGTSYVWCYTQEDIQKLEEFSKDIDPRGGRPPKDKE